jgi:hypothetical protein
MTTSCDFFQLLNRFQIFFSDKSIPKVTGHGQNSSKRNLLKEGVDSFNDFQLFYVRQIYEILSNFGTQFSTLY